MANDQGPNMRSWKDGLKNYCLYWHIWPPVHQFGAKKSRQSRFRDGFLQERNIYRVNGRVVYVTWYYKSQALFGEAKVISQYQDYGHAEEQNDTISTEQ
jgi:hypothetical protein